MTLTLNNIDISYRSKRVLDSVSLEIKKDSTDVILGPNGAGKTTLVRAISGVMIPSCGSISLDGRKAKPKDLKNVVSVLPQRLPVFSWALTVDELILYTAQIRKVSKKEFKARKDLAYDILPLKGINDRTIGNLSGGQARIAYIAATCISYCDYIILDEPTVALDPLAKSAVWHYLSVLQKMTSCGILITTHQLNDIDTGASRIIFLKDSGIYWSGNSADISKFMGDSAVVLTRERLNLPSYINSTVMSEEFGYRYVIQRSHLVEVVTYLESSGIKDFKIDTISLEEIYRRLVLDTEGIYVDNNKTLVDI